MFKLRLLIVEDEQSQLNIWNEKIDLHNAENHKHGFVIEQTQVKSLEEAKNTLTLQDFDAAVIDVRLEVETGKGPNDHGNEVLKIVIENELAVIAIFSAETNIANIPKDSASVIHAFRKGDGNGTNAVMEWLKTQSDIIKYIQRAQREIKKEMARLFNKSIWPRWDNWTTNKNINNTTPSFVTDALTRHLTAYIYASFLEKSGQGLHPEEWYFIPPIRDGLRTGDIVYNNGDYEVVITPRCDIATGKYETYQFVQCKQIGQQWDALQEELRIAKEKKMLMRRAKQIVKLIT